MIFIIGIVIGLLLGLTGAGGSVFAVPLLVLLGGLPVAQALGLSLGAVAATTLYASVINLGNKNILWAPAIILALSGALTAPVGQSLGRQLPERGLLMGFSALAIIIAWSMWRSARSHPQDARLVRSGDLGTHISDTGFICPTSPKGQFSLRPRCLSALLLGGLLIGLLSGLFGVGGGFLIVPLLLFLGRVSMVQAISSSLLIIAVISSAGFITHLLLNYQALQEHAGAASDWTTFGLIVSGGVIGMFAGQRLSGYIASAILQQIFAVCLLAISLVTILTSH